MKSVIKDVDIYKAYWPNLLKIYLRSNKIDEKVCKYLSEANWPKLLEIFLSN